MNLQNRLHPKIAILCLLLTPNSHLTTKQYNFYVKCRCISESYDRQGFLRTKFGCGENLIVFLKFLQRERVFWCWLAGPFHNKKKSLNFSQFINHKNHNILMWLDYWKILHDKRCLLLNSLSCKNCPLMMSIKTLAYGRHWISQCVQIVAPIQKIQ